MKKLIFIFPILLISSLVNAFEKQEIVFSPKKDAGANVKFTFNGEILSPSLSVLKPGEVKRSEDLVKVILFLNKLYKANVDGSKEKILEVWDSADKTTVLLAMDDASLKANKERFSSIKDLRLKTLIEYGSKYICLVEVIMEGEKPFVMKFPIIKKSGDLYLTNSMNEDYFYSNLSHYVDSSNFAK